MRITEKSNLDGDVFCERERPSFSSARRAGGEQFPIYRGGPSRERELTLFDFPGKYPITLYSFTIPGLGREGPKCHHQRMSHLSSDGSAVRYSLIHCRRVECPKCWRDWALRMVFELAMRIEAYARLTDRRPHALVMSIPPQRISSENWTWERVSAGLFRRGYRRARNHAGVKGGIVVFHPYRIRKRWQTRFRCSRVHEETGMWNTIRKKVQRGASLHDFVEFGPHVHSIVFGEPNAHECDDYLIRFNDDDHHLPVELSSPADVVKLLRYLITHAGILEHLKRYRNGVARQRTHAIRSFGELFRFNPRSVLSPGQYNALAEEIAGLLWLRKDANGNPVTMCWNEANQELEYPASCKGFDTSEERIEWLPIHELPRLANDEAWMTRLSLFQSNYWLRVLAHIVQDGAPPEYGVVKEPSDVRVFLDVEPEEWPSEKPAHRAPCTKPLDEFRGGEER